MASNIKIERVCLFCKNSFIARTTTTKYCSQKCASRAYKERARDNKIHLASESKTILPKKITRDLGSKEFLTPSQAAELLGIGRSTIYRYLQSEELKCVQLKGKTIIRRSDIDALFNNTTSYQAKPICISNDITEFYTIAEIEQKYGCSKSCIFNTVKKNNIPKVLRSGKSYFSKYHIEKHFNHFLAHTSIEEWYTTDDICQKYNLTKTAVYSFVKDHNIPRKKKGLNTLYSKFHFDVAKGVTPGEEKKYYTTEEAMAKYHITRDMLYNHIRNHKVSRIKEGRFIKISKSELDKIFENLIIKQS
ncbi:MAG: helix-turn-helix domain-containing protein [Tannerellaceae bacterium]